MSVITVTATADPTNVPPRVQLVATDTGTPAFVRTTVVRNNPDGTQVPVRTADGAAALLSGGTVTLYDYEMPFGQAVTYSSLETPANVTTPVTVDAAQVWLIHPGIPSLSIPILLGRGSFTKRTRAASRAVFRPMGRSTPVVIGDGARKTVESDLVVMTTTIPERLALEELTADAGVLYLNIPTSLGYNFETCYISVGDIDEAPVTEMATETYMTSSMPFTVVDRPAGGSQSTRTFADLLVYPNLAALRTAYPTFAAVLAGP